MGTDQQWQFRAAQDNALGTGLSKFVDALQNCLARIVADGSVDQFFVDEVGNLEFLRSM